MGSARAGSRPRSGGSIRGQIRTSITLAGSTARAIAPVMDHPIEKKIARWKESEFEAYARRWMMETLGFVDDATALLLGSRLSSLAPRLALSNQGRSIPTDVRALLEAEDSMAPILRTPAIQQLCAPPRPQSLGPAWLVELAATLYVSDERDRLQYPAIPEVIAADLALILAGRSQPDGTLIRIDGNIVGDLAGGGDLPKLHASLGTVAAHRVLRFLVAKVWVNAVRRTPVPDQLIIDGAWRGLAARLGFVSRSFAQDLQRAGEALASLVLYTPLGPEHLVRIHVAKTGTKPTLTLDAVGPLALGYTVRLRDAHKKHRKLVPLRAGLPALTGHRRSHAQQLSFEMLFLRQFRLRARFEEKEDAVAVVAEIPRSVVQSEATKAGLSTPNRKATRAVWQGEGGWLVRDKATYTFCGNALPMEGYLAEGLEMTETGRRRRAKLKARR